MQLPHSGNRILGFELVVGRPKKSRTSVNELSEEVVGDLSWGAV